MQILDPNRLPDGKRRVVVLGNFDGVHKGHKKLLTLAKSLSADDTVTCVYTFSQNSAPIKSANLLTTNDEKTEYIIQSGISEIYFDDFSRVRGMSPEQFCKEILVETLGCEVAVCGENFTFGKDRAGTPSTLESIMSSLSKKTAICPLCFEDGKPVSSSLIREHLLAGDISAANMMLERPYSFTSAVVHGKALARRLGFPTINQIFPERKIKPKNGVYVSVCTVDGTRYVSVSNIGTKPTVVHSEANPPVICESHIIGFDMDIYGKSVTTDFVCRIRDEIKFDSLDALSVAMKKDVLSAKKYFEEKGLF